MSSHLYTPAYATRLGNLTAKSVLVRIADQAGDEDGVCWPGWARIAKDTEITLRTTLRMKQVFVAMDLIEVKEMVVSDRYGTRAVEGIVLNLAMLGCDLTGQFARCYAEAQGKDLTAGRAGKLCLRDRKRDVSETESDVSETESCVSETFPPDPLLGRSIIDPASDPAVIARVQSEEPTLKTEQREHLDRLAAEGKPLDNWLALYAEENLKAAETARALAGREAALRMKYPDRVAAIATLRKECGFAWLEKGDDLGPVLDRVFRDQEELGREPWRIAAQMVEMWMLQRKQGPRLRARYGPMKFFRDGYWLDSAGWHWNTEVLARETGASVGSRKSLSGGLSDGAENSAQAN